MPDNKGGALSDRIIKNLKVSVANLTKQMER